MRKIIVTEFITLDGVIEAPGGNETDHPHAGWQPKFGSPETGQYKIDELASVECLLLGRVTYDVFAGYWPGESGGNAFADRMNQMSKFVVSNTLQQAEWNNTRIIRDIAIEIAALKKMEGGNMLVYGSGTLVKGLLHHKLVDELHLLLYPVSIGGGLRLFDDNLELTQFTLKHSHAYDNGAMLLEYLAT